MPDRENVIGSLEVRIISDTDAGYSTIEIPVNEAERILALLKEQEAVEPTFRQGEDGVFVWACGSCGAYMYHIYDEIDKAKEYAKYCRQCGRAVKWDEI